MMKQIITIILFSLLITSCQFNPLKKEQIEAVDIHTGRSGVTLEFMENAPPNEVYEEKPFDIIVKVHNKGANAVVGGMLIMGVEDQNVDLRTEKDARFDLIGKSEFNPEGVFELKTFRAYAKNLGPSIAKQYTTTITATACYQYKTSATALVCIDTDLLNAVKDKPCTTRTESYASGQGAPLSVVSVTPKMMPHEDDEYITPEFTIILSNPGGGDVVDSDKVYEACTGKKVGREDWNKVTLQASISEQPLECLPETIILRAGENKVVCTLASGIEKIKGTYTAPLSIDLEYGYMSRKIKTTDILKPVIK